MKTGLKEIRSCLARAVFWGALALCVAPAGAQNGVVEAGPPPSSGGFFPLREVHRGLMATAWTVFTGTKPEAMQVEILGVLRGARGPGHDLILAQLHGAKPEYTGVVAGMSGSPVYVGNRLLGSLSYRIGQFSKEPIAGITPIEQMLEVRDLPIVQGQRDKGTEGQVAERDTGSQFQPMETPLLMSGFDPAAVRLWQEKMAGTGLELVTAGGSSGSSANGMGNVFPRPGKVVPGSAVSAQLVRGDVEIAATCTVTYVDAQQLLACGHPLLQAGPVSLPMTASEVVATLASPLNAFKIINTGELIGAFTEDRDAAIRGVFGAQPHMIPVHITVHGSGKARTLNVEVLDLSSLTPQALLVTVYNSLLQTNENTQDSSYHVTGTVAMEDYPASPIDVWASGGEAQPGALSAALQVADRFNKLYSNNARRGSMRSVDLNVEAVPRRVDVDLISARLISSDMVHAGDTVMVEASVRPWQQPVRNVRIPVKLPARLQAGALRVLVSDAGTLDRTLDQPRLMPRPTDMETVLAQAKGLHREDQIYVSLLLPETQAGMEGHTLSALPLSLANALEPLRNAQDVTLNGESAVPVAHLPAGGALTGFAILNLRIDPGGGVN